MRHRLRRLAYYLRVGHHWLLRRELRVAYLPEYVSVEVTNLCNFKCSFCPQSSPSHFAAVGRSFMTAERADQLLGKLRQAGVRSTLLHWTLDGEPFMNRQFHELCEVACRWGFSDIAFATNGSLCTPRRLLELPRAAHYVLGIDFCADVDHFERVRGPRGSWAHVRRNVLAALADDRLAHIRIRLKDISSFDVSDRREQRVRFRRLQRLFPASHRLSFATKTFHNATGFLTTRAGHGRRYHRCPYPWATLNIASNGEVVACSRDLQHKTVLGNLLAQPLDEIWNGLPMQALRRDLRDRRPELQRACAGCDMPYDDSKITLRNFLNSARGRLQLLA
jgi:radical SAM protein with 4Fe4S-binding SPASM domain